MAVRFVSDTPPQTLVDPMAQAYLVERRRHRNGLANDVRSPEFWSPEVYRAKIKTPIEFVVSAVRATNADVNNPLPLVRALEKLGMPLYGMQTPNGYSWTGRAVGKHRSSRGGRMNFAVALSLNRVGGTYIDWTAPCWASEGTQGTVQPSAMANPPDPSTRRSVLNLLLLGQPVSEQTRAAVLKQLEQQPNRAAGGTGVQHPAA